MKTTVIINGEELRTKLEELIPTASLDEDNDGQVIIYTGLAQTKNGNYYEMK